MNTTPATISLDAEDPAELLAQASLFLGSVIHDGLVLIGRRENGAPMACRVPLEDIAAMTDSHRVSALVEKPLISLLENDCNGAYLLIVLGDGFDPDDGKKAREAMVQIAVLVLTLAVTMLPEPLEITSAWIVGGGRALEVRVFDVDEEGVSIGTREHGPITPVTATRVMAQAVHAGVMVPQDSPIEHWYAVGRGLAGSRTRGRTLRAADVGAALTELPALLGGVRDAEPTMSECERLVSLMRYLGRRDCWWDVLALVLARGTAGPELDDDLVGALVKDPRHQRGHGPGEPGSGAGERPCRDRGDPPGARLVEPPVCDGGASRRRAAGGRGAGGSGTLAHADGRFGPEPGLDPSHLNDAPQHRRTAPS
jgi:hypothetical protein